MASFVYDDFSRIVHKAAIKYTMPRYTNVDTEVVVNKVLVSLRSHLQELEEETKWKVEHNVHDKFMIEETTEVPTKEDITVLLSFLRKSINKEKAKQKETKHNKKFCCAKKIVTK